MGPALRLRRFRAGDRAGAMRLAGVCGLGALVWATASEHDSDGSPRVPLTLFVVTGIAWVAWLTVGRLGASPRVTVLVLAALAGAGGAVGGLAPIGITFPAVAVIAAAALRGVGSGAAVAVVGATAVATTVLIAGSPRAIIVEGALALAAALLGGITRRQYQERAVQAEQLLAERIRGDAERDRAASLAERNRVGREIHDVLAHSLGALSVQLDAAGALLDTDGNRERVRELVEQARRGAVDGLAEARRAVQALRDEPVALTGRLAALARTNGERLTVAGVEHALTADGDLAIYRAAQEALSNARKHAPSAPVTVQLDYQQGATVLVVANGRCPGGPVVSSLSATGGGAGLRGMRERIESVGGDLSVTQDDRGRTIRAAVPR